MHGLCGDLSPSSPAPLLRPGAGESTFSEAPGTDGQGPIDFSKPTSQKGLAFAWRRSVRRGPSSPELDTGNQQGGACQQLGPSTAGHSTRALPSLPLLRVQGGGTASPAPLLPEDSLQGGFQVFRLSDSWGAAGRGIKGPGVGEGGARRPASWLGPTLDFSV